MGVVQRRGEEITITLTKKEVFELRLALQACPCRAPKSNSTAEIRRKLADALGPMLFARTRTPDGEEYERVSM